MACKNCKSVRVASITAKCSDCFGIVYDDGYSENGYVPGDIGIGDGDYVEFEYCLNCGMIQGDFPLPKVDEIENEEAERFFNE